MWHAHIHCRNMFTSVEERQADFLHFVRGTCAVIIEVETRSRNQRRKDGRMAILYKGMEAHERLLGI